MIWGAVTGVATAVVIFGPLLGAGPALAADYTLSIDTALATTDPLFAGLEACQASVAEASGGRMEIKLFPNSQLGADEDLL